MRVRVVPPAVIVSVVLPGTSLLDGVWWPHADKAERRPGAIVEARRARRDVISGFLFDHG
jgi:hypothetical protein